MAALPGSRLWVSQPQLTGRMRHFAFPQQPGHDRAVPASYGPFYAPAYLGPADEARLQPTGKSPAPPRMLWIEPRNRRCGFLLWADADEANLVLSWSVSVSYRDRIKQRLPCRVVDTLLDAPLLIEDLDTGQRIAIQRLRRGQA